MKNHVNIVENSILERAKEPKKAIRIGDVVQIAIEEKMEFGDYKTTKWR